jgi:hypothetical protein
MIRPSIKIFNFLRDKYARLRGKVRRKTWYETMTRTLELWDYIAAANEEFLLGRVGDLRLNNVCDSDVRIQLAYKPVYACSALSARGGKFPFIAREPGYVTVDLTFASYLATALSSYAFLNRSLPKSLIQGRSLCNSSLP